MCYFLRNYRMNVKIHHFSIRLHVLGRTTQAQLPSFTFMALYSRRLWYWKQQMRDPVANGGSFFEKEIGFNLESDSDSE